MATEVKLPRLGQGMESGTIVKWLKSEGEAVEKGEPLYELDTDKVTQEVEADASGVLLKIAVTEGEVEVGRTIGVIGEQGEEVTLPENGAAAAAAPAPAEPSLPAVSEATSPAPSAPSRDGGRIKASPLARRIARERGVDLASIAGTGPDGRIVAEDVERAAAAPAMSPGPVQGQVEVTQLSSIRRTIARRLSQAWEAPVFQLVVSADMTQALGLVASLRELRPDERPTVTDVLTRVTATALVRHRDVNAHYLDDAIHVYPAANVGIAVAAPQGLVVPVIHGAERLSLAEIARVRGDLVERARAGALRREDIDGGTFTISNLGMFGVEQFVAVLNPPQVAILAVGSTDDRVVVRDGQLAEVPTMMLTLTCDHRAIDGAVGAAFLRTVKQLVESPALAL